MLIVLMIKSEAAHIKQAAVIKSVQLKALVIVTRKVCVLYNWTHHVSQLMEAQINAHKWLINYKRYFRWYSRIV